MFAKTKNMKKVNLHVCLILLLLNNISGFCQDTIKKTDGEIIEAKIAIIDKSTVKYKAFNNQNGPFYVIQKNDLASVQFENGTVENFQMASISKGFSKTALQEFIVKSINEYGFEEDTFDRKYRASFEGDYLRLIVLRKSGEPCNAGILYDFSNVYEFQKISNRSEKLAYINIFVSIAKNKKQTKWDRHKLIMRVNSPSNAALIVNALKDYNSVLTKSGSE